MFFIGIEDAVPAPRRIPTPLSLSSALASHHIFTLLGTRFMKYHRHNVMPSFRTPLKANSRHHADRNRRGGLNLACPPVLSAFAALDASKSYFNVYLLSSV